MQPQSLVKTGWAFDHTMQFDSFGNTNAVHIKFVDRNGFTHNTEYTTTDVTVGEKIELTAVPEPSITVTPKEWSIGGASVKDYTQTLQAAQITTNSAADLQSTTNVVFRWTAGGQDALVTYTYFYEGQEYTSRARFNVHAPSASLSSASTSESPPVGIRPFNGQMYLMFGSTNSPGITWTASVGWPAIGRGAIALVQRINTANTCFEATSLSAFQPVLCGGGGKSIVPCIVSTTLVIPMRHCFTKRRKTFG